MRSKAYSAAASVRAVSGVKPPPPPPPPRERITRAPARALLSEALDTLPATDPGLGGGARKKFCVETESEATRTEPRVMFWYPSRDTAREYPEFTGMLSKAYAPSASVTAVSGVNPPPPPPPNRERITRAPSRALLSEALETLPAMEPGGRGGLIVILAV